MFHRLSRSHEGPALVQGTGAKLPAAVQSRTTGAGSPAGALWPPAFRLGAAARSPSALSGGGPVVQRKGYITGTGRQEGGRIDEDGLYAERNGTTLHHIIAREKLTNFSNAMLERGDWEHFGPAMGHVVEGGFKHFREVNKQKAAKIWADDSLTREEKIAKLKQFNTPVQPADPATHGPRLTRADVGHAMTRIGQINQNPGDGGPEPQPLDDHENSAATLMARFFLWMPGNLHEGPRPDFRMEPGDDQFDPTVDDGGSGFEWAAKHVMPGHVFQALSGANQLIDEYMGEDDAGERQNKLAVMAEHFQVIANQRSHEAYNPKNWRKVKDKSGKVPGKLSKQEQKRLREMRFLQSVARHDPSGKTDALADEMAGDFDLPEPMPANKKRLKRRARFTKTEREAMGL